MTYSTSQHNASFPHANSLALTGTLSVSNLRPNYFNLGQFPLSQNFNFNPPASSSSNRYVDELRTFNVKDYLPVSRDKLDVKLNFSYGDEFKSYLGREPGAGPGYTTRVYHPTSMMNLSRPSCNNVGPTFGSPAPVPVRKTVSTVHENQNAAAKKQCVAVKAQPKCGKNPDHNNNFFKDARGKFGADLEKWMDCYGNNRLEELARPKLLPSEYRDNRRSVYWMTKRPPPKPEGCNHTHFETTCRLDQLAAPKVVCGEFCGKRHCCWECEYPQPPVSCIDPRSVDWNRLACPKKKYPPNGVEIKHVKRAALKALPTKRVCKLSEPKKVIDSGKYYLWLWNKKPDNAVMLKTIRRLCIEKCDLTNIRVMVRLQLSCTATEESCRILKATIPNIKYALDKGAQSVVIICNYGNCNGKNDTEFSLQPLTEIFQKHLGRQVIYLEDCVGYQARSLCADPEPGSVFLLENLSFHAEEAGKVIGPDKVELCKPEDIAQFCNTLFGFGDVYIVDAISELVDMSNTTVGVKDQEKAYGFIIHSELQHYNRYVVNPVQPMVAIIGGKFKDKIKILRNLMGKAQDVILGGELAMIFLNAIKKIEIGNIEITPKMIKKALKTYTRAQDTKTALYLPSDVVVKNVTTGQYFTVLTREDIDEEYEVVDIGPFTRICYMNVIANAKTIVWSGQMGDLPDGTVSIAHAFAEATRKGALTYITDELTKDVFFCSGQSDVTHVTANGEVTTMLLNGKLPKGLAVLNKYRKKIKKNNPKSVIPSSKPTVYELPGVIINGGSRLKCINDVSLEDKRVVIRVDFDVTNPKTANLANDYRIRMTIPTIKYALRNRAKSVVILAHCGFPGGRKVPELTLKPICEALATLLGQTVK